MRLKDQATHKGLIVNLSSTGNLFVSYEDKIKVKAGTVGRMRFSMPTSLIWLEPRIVVKRSTTFPRPTGGEPCQAFGFEFVNLNEEEERAMVAGSEDWAEHVRRTYPLAARCQIESLSATRQFKRAARIVAGSRSEMVVRVHAGMRVPTGVRVRLIGQTAYINGTIMQVMPSPTWTEMLVALDQEWGRDFFLHDLRRQALALVTRGASAQR